MLRDFARMHDDYLDPDRYFGNQEPDEENHALTDDEIIACENAYQDEQAELMRLESLNSERDPNEDLPF